MKAALLMLAAVATMGCGDDSAPAGDTGALDCAAETRALTYSPGLTVTGSNGYGFALVESMPAPPARNDNVWTVEITDDANALMTGLELDVSPWMPDHGHGAKVAPNISAGASDGLYVIDPVNLWMPGYWEVTISISDSQGPADEAVFQFCIDQ